MAVPAALKAYEVMQVTTSMPSFKGTPVGLYDDPLKPTTSFEMGKKYWVEITLTTVGSSTIGSFTVATKAGPMKTMPFYAELQSRQTLLAHNLQDNVAYQCPITNKYTALLRAHGVEPIKQFITSFPSIKNGQLDLDGYFPEYGCDFRTMVITGAINPPMIFSWAPAASTAFITATKATALPAGSWAYGWDEGQGSMDAQALAQAQAYKQSGLLVLETRTPTPEFAPYVDIFCPVLNFSPYTASVGCGYVSCMSNGNCVNQTNIATVASATGEPMMVIEASGVHQRAFPWVLAKLNIPRGLYFNTTQRLPTAWQTGGQYNEGGNGDGTLLYPGTDGNPWPSLRLKKLHRGLQDVWYLGKGAINPVTNAKTWPKDEATYEAERLKAWNSL